MTNDAQEEQVEKEQEEVEVVADESAESPTPADDGTQELKKDIKIIRDHLQLMAQRTQTPKPEEEAYVDPVDKLTRDHEALKVQLAEAKMMAKHNDFEEVITKYLPQAIKEEPSIAQWLTSTDYEKAYFIAKKSNAYLKDRAIKPKTTEAKEPAKIGSISGMGSATAASSEPNFFAMTDEEFMKYKRAKTNY